MKKIYILLFIFFVKNYANAQYTITSASNPTVGDIELVYNCDTTGIKPGPTGTGQVWNYTLLSFQTGTAATQTSSYLATSAAPCGSLVANANIAKTDDQGVSYSLMGYTNTGMTGYAYCNNSITIIFTNPQNLINYPFTYGMASSDTYSGTGAQGTVAVVLNGTVSVTADAAGSINLPPGKTFFNGIEILRLYA